MNETVEPNAHFNGGLADVIHSNKPFSNLKSLQPMQTAYPLPIQPVQPVQAADPQPVQPVQRVQPTQQNLVPVAAPTPVQPKIDVSFLDDLL